MPPRYPAPLRPGARIKVTAPSSSVDAPLHPRLDLVLHHLRSSGWLVGLAGLLIGRSAAPEPTGAPRIGISNALFLARGLAAHRTRQA